MRALVLRLEAPLMSFGSVIIDNLGVTDVLPGASMLTGLIGNALGLERRQGQELNALQESITYAARRDVPGVPLVDYQTADLGQEFMLGGWTTRGKFATRAGSAAAARGTHIRYRHFLANAAVTVAIASPRIDEFADALRRPARPLFIGRKPCLPARPIVDTIVEASCLRDALLKVPVIEREQARDPFNDVDELEGFVSRWPLDDGGHDGATEIFVNDTRDFINQIHVGRRAMWQGRLPAPRPAEVLSADRREAEAS